MEELIRRLVDENEIRNLVARLAHLADLSEDLDEYYGLWTEDGVYDVREPIGWKPGDPSYAKKVAGQKALRADRVMLRSTGFQGPGSDVWHANTTLSVTVDGDTAEARSHWVLIDGKREPKILRIGHYQDSFRRTGTGWKIAERIVTPNGSDHRPEG